MVGGAARAGESATPAADAGRPLVKGCQAGSSLGRVPSPAPRRVFQGRHERKVEGAAAARRFLIMRASLL